MKNDLISVVIPAYNSEKHIKECLYLTTKQTYQNLEIIIVDDGSNDNTGNIIKSMARLDERIKYFYQDNQGQSCARNFALERVSGEYIVFIDSDDIFELDLIEELYNKIKKDNLDISITMLDYYRGNKLLHSNNGILNEDIIVTNIDAIKLMLMCNEIRFHPVCKMFKRDIFNEVRFPIGKIYEDVITIFLATLKAEKIGYVNKVLYHYKINDDSTTHNNRFDSKRFQLYEYALEIENILNEKFPYENFSNEIIAFKVDAYRTLNQAIKKLEDSNKREGYLKHLKEYKKNIKLKNVLFNNKILLKAKIKFILHM